MELIVDTSRLKWFADSPDAGPDCICSLCDEPILEPEIPLRVYDDWDAREIRLHTKCWNEVSPHEIQRAFTADDHDPYMDDRL